MTIHLNTFRGTGILPALSIDDLFRIEREPRVADLALGRLLAFAKPHNIRKLIERHRGELELHGPLVSLSASAASFLRFGENSKSKGGRPGIAFYLTEGQALTICAVARTEVGAAVRRELIRVFMERRYAGDFYQVMPAARRALRHICKEAHIVKGPRIFASQGAHELFEERAPAADGEEPYLLTPMSASLIDALAQFEDELTDAEDDDPAGGNDIDSPADHEEADAEPSLGATEAVNHDHAWGRLKGDAPIYVDVEAEHDGREPDDSDFEPDCDGEPSLGFTNDGHSNGMASADDGEDSLGSTNSINQTAWSFGRAGDYEQENDGREPDADFEEEHDREHDAAEMGIGDEDGLAEQTGRAL